MFKRLFKLVWKNKFEEDLSLEKQYQLCKKESDEDIRCGLDDLFNLRLESIWLKISYNCNLRCVGCYSERKFQKKYAGLEEIKKLLECEGPIKEISLTSCEPLLHPQFCEVIYLCKERHPQADIWVITNGTIPITGKYKEAMAQLDRVGLSIDGASKSTFENIRVGANFERFLKNAATIVDIKRETGHPREITFSFTATASNLHELPDLVRLGHQLGISNIWAQAMEYKDDVSGYRIKDILIDHLDPVLRTRLVDQARAEAKNLGISFAFSPGIYPVSEKSGDSDAAKKALHVKMCRYPWGQPPQIYQKDGGFILHPCCYISPLKSTILKEKYKLFFPHILSSEEAYNSRPMWNFRQALVDGHTADVCGQCAAARGYQWKPH